MKPITREKLACRARAMEQARQTIDRTLTIVEGKNILSEQRRAELQACAVIMRRAIDDIWIKYDLTPKV